MESEELIRHVMAEVMAKLGNDQVSITAAPISFRFARRLNSVRITPTKVLQHGPAAKRLKHERIVLLHHPDRKHLRFVELAAD